MSAWASESGANVAEISGLLLRGFSSGRHRRRRRLRRTDRRLRLYGIAAFPVRRAGGRALQQHRDQARRYGLRCFRVRHLWLRCWACARVICSPPRRSATCSAVTLGRRASLKSPPDGPGGSIDADRDGYFVGVGVETAIASNWTLKTEYRFTQFGTDNVLEDLGVPDGLINSDASSHTFHVGANYRFGTQNGGGAAFEVPAYNWTGFYVGGAARCRRRGSPDQCSAVRRARIQRPRRRRCLRRDSTSATTTISAAGSPVSRSTAVIPA